MITEDEKQIKRLLWEYGTADERIKDINLQIRLQKETQESMRDIVYAAFEQGLSAEVIASLTHMPVDEIEKLRETSRT